MRKFLLASVALTPLIAAPALAADMAVKAPLAAPVRAPVYETRWTGCYLGGHAGFAWSNDKATVTNGATSNNASWNPNEFIGGAQLGCQYQWTDWVFGLEGTWSGSDLDQSSTSTAGGVTTRSTFDLDEFWTVTGRIGHAWDRFMLYAKGGYANARIKTKVENLTVPDSGLQTAWENGFTVGGGIDYMPWRDVIVGVEFDYYNFGFNRDVPLGSGAVSHVTNTNSDVFAVMGRASWLFH